MTDDEILDQAYETDCVSDDAQICFRHSGLIEFARAIEARARAETIEECAKVCDELVGNAVCVRDDCAAAIRALKERPAVKGS
jgi:hypothetical protein